MRRRLIVTIVGVSRKMKCSGDRRGNVRSGASEGRRSIGLGKSRRKNISKAGIIETGGIETIGDYNQIKWRPPNPPI